MTDFSRTGTIDPSEQIDSVPKRAASKGGDVKLIATELARQDLTQLFPDLDTLPQDRVDPLIAVYVDRLTRAIASTNTPLMQRTRTKRKPLPAATTKLASGAPSHDH